MIWRNFEHWIVNLFQIRISEILNQTQYFFDCLASDSVKLNKIGNIVARDKFLEGLQRLGVWIINCTEGLYNLNLFPPKV